MDVFLNVKRWDPIREKNKNFDYAIKQHLSSQKHMYFKNGEDIQKYLKEG